MNTLAEHALLCWFPICMRKPSSLNKFRLGFSLCYFLDFHLQECLQGEVVTLQRQLTWMQSHASLQDNINKDLMQEVLHLREAVVSLSAMPPAE